MTSANISVCTSFFNHRQSLLNLLFESTEIGRPTGLLSPSTWRNFGWFWLVYFLTWYLQITAFIWIFLHTGFESKQDSNDEMNHFISMCFKTAHQEKRSFLKLNFIPFWNVQLSDQPINIKRDQNFVKWIKQE